jgi:hypothetical protein
MLKEKIQLWKTEGLLEFIPDVLFFSMEGRMVFFFLFSNSYFQITSLVLLPVNCLGLSA